MKVRAHYIAEAAANPTGGLRQGATYTHQVDLGADLDLGRLAGLPGGKVRITFTERTGYSLTQDYVGSITYVQEIFGAGQNIRLAELSYDQSMWQDKVRVKLGWMHTSDDFASSPLYCYFQNNAVCGQNGVVIDSGFSIFPAGAWGTLVKVQADEELYVQAGVYEVNPTLSEAANGFKLGFSGATGVVLPVQVGWQPRLGPDALPGHYRIGAFRDTSRTAYLGSPIGGPTSMSPGRWGVYAQAEQMILRTAPDADRGLSVFAALAYAGPQTALIETWWQAGLLRKGTFAGRDDDSIGLAVNQYRISSVLAAAQQAAALASPGSTAVQTAETIIELNYRAKLLPWMTLMPNVQYLIRPSGLATIPNALVLGLQARVTL
ncbi:MAG: carbohydrate porin [Reyranellaceae bacterium]